MYTTPRILDYAPQYCTIRRVPHFRCQVVWWINKLKLTMPNLLHIFRGTKQKYWAYLSDSMISSILKINDSDAKGLLAWNLSNIIINEEVYNYFTIRVKYAQACACIYSRPCWESIQNRRMICSKNEGYHMVALKVLYLTTLWHFCVFVR